ncbi:DUF1510 family protein [Radiobacillus sp. PE A8.2]|uniref:YrrS family protein n=1 Tax=Radiobacillus sp. PE A8.2 TaxID=3380349 RepID=UPI00388DCCF2
MAYERDPYTRVNRFEKKRKGTKTISWLIGVSSILIIALIAVFVFGNNGEDDRADTAADQNNGEDQQEQNPTDDQESSDTTEENNSPSDSESEPGSENEADEVTEEQESPSDEATDQSDTEVTEIEVTDDDNVIRAYTGDWEPVPTELQAPYAFSWKQDSQDWQDAIQAVYLATGLVSDDMITWRLENGGDKKMIATVSNNAQTEIYRVYLSWADAGGWLPTKVEELNENDKKEPETDTSDETTDKNTETDAE